MKKSVVTSLCALAGAAIAVFLDLLVKNEASIIMTAGRALRRIVPTSATPFLVVLVVLIVAFFLPYLLEVKNRRNAFLAGLGILATVFTAVPYQAPPALSSTPSSSLVTLVINASDDAALTITVTVVNKENQDRSSSKYDLKRERTVGFYLDAGNYVLTVRSPGFRIFEKEIIVEKGDAPLTFGVDLSRSIVPLNLQQLF